MPNRAPKARTHSPPDAAAPLGSRHVWITSLHLLLVAIASRVQLRSAPRVQLRSAPRLQLPLGPLGATQSSAAIGELPLRGAFPRWQRPSAGSTRTSLLTARQRPGLRL